MNWSHFYTLLWVRWRISINHMSKAGRMNAIILTILAGAGVVASAVGFVAGLVIGLQQFGKAPPEVFAYICDGWVAAFLFFWMIGLVNELQRSEMLSLDKLLHLPTTLTEVFLFNFLSSLFTLTTVTFVPPLVGLSIAAVVTRGPAMLLMFPLLATLLLMISALTYQFRGWLATLMQNKRRRQTVIVIFTMGIVVLAQVPNLINMAWQQQWRKQAEAGPNAELKEKIELQQQYSARKITAEEFVRKTTEVDERRQARRTAENRALLHRVHSTLDIVNIVLPIGWMAYGAQSAARGYVWAGIGGSLGMLAIAGFSLRRSYYTTLRYFTVGESAPALDSPVKPVTAANVAPGKPSRPIANWLERPLPLVSDSVAAIMWGTLRGMSRAPEVKMLLMGPLFVLCFYGAMMMSQRGGPGMPDVMRSFIPLAILGFSVAGISQLSHNTFGFDRAGLRAYVLSGVPRWEILMGKNLALVPITVMLTLPVLFIVQILSPAPWTQFGATLLEIPSALVLISLIGNFSSMYCPICQAAGSMKPNSVKATTMFVQFVFGMATLMILGIVTALPVSVELLLQFIGWVNPFVPLALLLALLELAAMVGLYQFVIRRQGKLLQARECQILDVVTQRGE